MKDPMVEDFSKWAAESFGVSERVDKRNDQAPTVKLQMDDNGFPILLKWEEIEQEGLNYKKILIGKSMRELYHIAVGGKRGRIPSAKIKEAPDDFILPKYLLDGVALTQYHHLRLQDVNALLKHWAQRQAAGEILLRFKKVKKVNQCLQGAMDGTVTEMPGPHGQGDASRSPSSILEDLPMEEHPEDEAQSPAVPPASLPGPLSHPILNHSEDDQPSAAATSNVQAPGDLLTEERPEDKAQNPVVPPAPLPYPCPRPLANHLRDDQSLAASTNTTPRNANSPPKSCEQEHANNDKTATDEGQGLLRDSKRTNDAAADDTNPCKCQKFAQRSDSVQPEARRSARGPWLVEWAKEAQLLGKKGEHR
ncbi:hypothetical protein EI94DRAFT_795606 [Lactarius quietus]|nr:hypothetical protein EI94DRAFT_795606 [Lactarius quietus]